VSAVPVGYVVFDVEHGLRVIVVLDNSDDVRLIRNVLIAGGSKMWTGNNTAAYSSQSTGAAYC